MWVTVYVDASYCNKTGAAGWAAWLRCSEGRRVVSGYCRCASSTEAELVAIVLGIKAAIATWAGQVEAVLVKSDCQGAVDFASFTGPVPQGKRLRKIQQRLREICKAADVWRKVEWTKGHATGSGVPAYLNNRVDALARASMKKARRKLLCRGGRS